MPPYPRYSQYHQTPRRDAAGFRFGKYGIIIGVVGVLYFIIRALIGGPGDPALVDGTNQPIVPDTNTAAPATTESNVNAAVNENVNTNTNSSSNVNTAAETASIAPDECDQVFSRGDTNEKRVTLTFNVGTTKSGEITSVLQSLKSAGVTADFFARGDVAESNPDMIRQISDAGFPVYNLTYNHTRATDLSAEELTDELAQAQEAISAQATQGSKPFFRPPYGAADEAVVSTAAADGYCTVTWTVDALDWSSDYTPEQSRERVIDAIGNGAIILMQASNATTAEIVPELIRQIQDQGYAFVDLHTNLGIK
ncbi:MAG: polysaccharide deacetylase family protein [Patescibacteria group bacterium]